MRNIAIVFLMFAFMASLAGCVKTEQEKKKEHDAAKTKAFYEQAFSDK